MAITKAQRAMTRPKTKAKEIVNYTTATEWLAEHADYERMRIVPYDKDTFSLKRMRILLDELGKPHEQLQCVQVAGTKGKGSTCAMLDSMLRNCGYTVGLFTSPHLVDLRERIAIGDSMISYADMADILKKIAKIEEGGAFGDDSPSFFEIMTGVAMRYFADNAVDVVVLEAGLGGRLDSTTAIDPLVCGLTQISLDHTQILGDDLVAIAREKAGIFKKGIPAVSVVQEEAVTEALKEEAEKAGTPLEFTGEQIDFSYRFEANR
ncbi:MAG: Mur ligase family protein, partial [Phycisphaeraceae bacterium]|nr:Mur ligase family protein [Phycisphaeraceae bacterium]